MNIPYLVFNEQGIGVVHYRYVPGVYMIRKEPQA